MHYERRSVSILDQPPPHVKKNAKLGRGRGPGACLAYVTWVEWLMRIAFSWVPRSSAEELRLASMHRRSAQVCLRSASVCLPSITSTSAATLLSLPSTGRHHSYAPFLLVRSLSNLYTSVVPVDTAPDCCGLYFSCPRRVLLFVSRGLKMLQLFVD